MEDCKFIPYEMFPHLSYSVRVVFVQEPPDDLRKSNFFKFTVAFRGINDQPLDIENATFVQYLNEDHDMDLRNGIKYNIIFRFPNGVKEQRDLYVTLVDAASTQPVPYEGQDDNPKMKRVLLTHETICSRCSQQKSCGNKNEAPSDPLIVEKGILRFFLKCNQNCLKGAGNPKDMRRFSMALSFHDITHSKGNIIALSKKIFVHNNSKHNRKRKKEPSFDPCQPHSTKILEVFPRNGACGTKFAIFGENFFSGMQVSLGNTSVLSEVMSDRVIHVKVPFLSSSTCPIIVRFGNQQMSAGLFYNDFSIQNNLACVHPKIGVRGEEFIVFGKELSSPDIVIVFNGMALDTKIIEKVGVMAVIPPNIAVGMIDVALFWCNQVLYWFRYQIQDRNHPGFSQSYGILTLCTNGSSAAHLPSDGFNEMRVVSIPGDQHHSSIFSSSGSTCSSSSNQSPYGASPYYNTSSPETLR